MKKQLLNVLKIVVSAGLMIYLLVFQVNLEQLWEVVRQARWLYLLAAMVLMIAGTALRAVRWQVLVQALDIKVPLGIFLLFTPIISFSLALPISVGGLGIREQTYILLFGSLGVADTVAAAMSLANHALTNLVVGLLGGILYAIEGTKGLTTHG